MKKLKQGLCLLLSAGLVLSLLTGCQSSAQAEPTQSPQETTAQEPLPAESAAPAEEQRETTEARELGIIPEGWEEDLSAQADFAGFDEGVTALIKLWDEAALETWQANVDSSAFPQRGMNRDDGLVLLMLAAEALGCNVYNARDYSFCTEYLVDYDAMYGQLSWDYPYCDTTRELPVYFDSLGGDLDPIGNVCDCGIFWMQRRMDINHRLHFLDCDENLDFHLDQPLSREAALAALVRLYDSEMLDYDPLATELRRPTEEDEALFAQVDELRESILNNTDELPCQGTAYYVSNQGSDDNDGLSPETAWASLERVNSA